MQVPKAIPDSDETKRKKNRSGSQLIIKRATLPHVESSRNIVYFGTAESLENIVTDLDSCERSTCKARFG
jgi:hypothetical protein